MFCPSCGRDNAHERRFCASCGTNLEAVSKALSGSQDNFLTKMDAALDQLIARYAERVFKDAPAKITERRVGNSWKVFGQGVATLFIDLVLISLMWNILPFRFLMLLISTPFRLFSQRHNRQLSAVELERKFEKQLPEPVANRLPDAVPNRWLSGSVPSVSEHTTQNLEERRQQERKRASTGE